jgi:ferredoxin
MRAPIDAVRIVVDGAKCDGHGICALILPERISLDAWGYASIENDPIEDTRTLARAKRAVAACPVHALALVGPVDVIVRLRRGAGRRPRDRAR